MTSFHIYIPANFLLLGITTFIILAASMLLWLDLFCQIDDRWEKHNFGSKSCQSGLWKLKPDQIRTGLLKKVRIRTKVRKSGPNWGHL